MGSMKVPLLHFLRNLYIFTIMASPDDTSIVNVSSLFINLLIFVIFRFILYVFLTGV